MLNWSNATVAVHYVMEEVQPPYIRFLKLVQPYVSCIALYNLLLKFIRFCAFACTYVNDCLFAHYPSLSCIVRSRAETQVYTNLNTMFQNI